MRSEFDQTGRNFSMKFETLFTLRDYNGVYFTRKRSEPAPYIVLAHARFTYRGDLSDRKNPYKFHARMSNIRISGYTSDRLDVLRRVAELALTSQSRRVRQSPASLRGFENLLFGCKL